MQLNEVAELKREFFGKALPLVEGRWRAYMDGIREAKPDVSDWELASTAICLENVYKKYTKEFGVDVDRLLETSETGNIANFIRHGFDLIAAVMPSLIANEIVSVQPLTRRKGEIFYLEYLYGTDKGAVHKNDKMFSRDVVGNDEIWYTSQKNVGFQLAVNGAAPAPGPFAGVINQQLPITPGTVRIVAPRAGGGADLVATDDGANNLIGDVVAGGTIDYATGTVAALTYTANVEANAPVLTTHETNYEKYPENIPEVDLSIASESVEAKPRRLKAKYTLDFGYDMQEEFGLNPEQLLSTGLGSEIRKEIDGELMKFLYDSAAAPAPTDWKKAPDPGISYAEHKWTFLDTIIEASNNIFEATRRANGNYIIAGMGVCNIIESLAPRFVRQGKTQNGPHFIGTLDNTYKVYKNPYYPRNEYLVGYKGELWIESGCIYSPYMPVFMTKPIMLDDFVNRRGIATSYATHKVTGLFYSKGKVV